MPVFAFSQNIQYLGTKDNTIVVRGTVRGDSGVEFPLTDTTKHTVRAGRIISWLGVPYWYTGTRWYKLNGDTSSITGQVNADWTSVSGVSVILNKPTFAEVATTGSYTDLTNKPTIPAAQVNSDYNAVSGVSQILNKPFIQDTMWRVIGKDSIFFRINGRTHSILDSAGASSGTVQSVSVGNLSPLFNSNTVNQTSTPVTSFTLLNAPAHTFLGDTSGSTGPPGYFPISIADLPNSIPVSKTLLNAVNGIILAGNQLKADTGLVATQYDVTHINYSSIVNPPATPNLQAVTTAGATTNLSVTGVTESTSDSSNKYATTALLKRQLAGFTGGGGITQITNDILVGPGTGVQIATLPTINSNVFGPITFIKHNVNAKGQITAASAVLNTDITGVLGYTPYHSTDTTLTLATKTDIKGLDTTFFVNKGNSGINVVYTGGDSAYFSKLIAGSNITITKGTDSSITINSTASGSGTTNITVTPSPTNNLVNSSSGSSGTINLVTNTNAGLQSPAEHIRGDSTIYAKNTGVGDTITYASLTRDTFYIKSLQLTNGGNQIITDNSTQNTVSFSIKSDTSAGSTKLSTQGNVTRNFYSINGGNLLGTGGTGFVGLATQNVTPTTPASGAVNIFTDSIGEFALRGSNGFVRSFGFNGLTANRFFHTPDSSGTIALQQYTAPSNRKITINGVTFDLVQDTAFTISSSPFGPVTGTTNRVTVTNGSTTPAIDISASYVGQSSITTVGPISIGSWNANVVSAQFGGTGLNTFTPYALVTAGTTSTGNFQQVSGLGTSGQALLSNGTSNLPSWQTIYTNPMTTLGDIAYENATPAPARLAGNTTTTKQFLSQTGNGTISAAPSWSAVSKTDVGLSNVENTALSTWAGSTNLNTAGTFTTGVWNGTSVAGPFGGTGQTSYTIGDILAASSSTTLTKVNDVAAGNVLNAGGVGVLPFWGKLNLATSVSGNLPVSNLNSGTGASSTSVWTGDGTWKPYINLYNTDGTLTGNRNVTMATNGLSFNGGNVGVSGGNFSVTGATSNNGTIGSSFLLNTPVNDPLTGASGTITHIAEAALYGGAISASNASVTATNASTLYINGAPTSSTNMTVVNPWSLYVNSGKSRFNGKVQIADGTQHNGYVFTSDANGVGSWTFLPTVTSSSSGSYTPTVIGSTNSNSISMGPAYYIQVGNVVTVTGSFTVRATVASSQSIVVLSLPVSTTFSAATDLSGTATLQNGGTYLAGIDFSDAIGNAEISFQAGNTNTYTAYYTYKYISAIDL